MATKITNSALFRACKWLTENTEITCEWLDTHNSREIMNMYELRSARYTVEYSARGREFGWRNRSYSEAVSLVSTVVNALGYRPEVWREHDRECVSREFDIPAWL